MLGRHAAILAVVAFPAVALADIAPPPNYVEPCSVELVQGPGETCELCAGAYHGDRDFCVREFGARGFEHRCNTRGASAWREVWCTDGSEAPAPGAVEGSGGDSPAADAVDAAAPLRTTSATEVPLAADDEGSASVAEPVVADQDGESGASTLPAEPPARSRGCAAASDRTAPLGLLALAGLLVLRRKRSV